jgi:hypothetical protein
MSQVPSYFQGISRWFGSEEPLLKSATSVAVKSSLGASLGVISLGVAAALSSGEVPGVVGADPPSQAARDRTRNVTQNADAIAFVSFFTVIASSYK